MGWDWSGATLVVEHCDKYIPEQNPEKGFLSLESEIDIVAEVGIGIHLNWGRSVVKGRCAQAAIEGGAEYLGAKVCVPKDASLAKRLAMLEGIYRACGLGE